MAQFTNFMMIMILSAMIVMKSFATDIAKFTMNSSCSVTADLATTIYGALNQYVQPSLSAVDIMHTILTYQQNQTLLEIPVPGPISASMIEKINSSYTRQILWSLFGQVPSPSLNSNGLAPNVQISSTDGYLINYGFSSVRLANGQGDGNALVIAPVSTTLTPYNGLIYSSCPNTQYYYYVDPDSGAFTSTNYFTTGSLNTCEKNWYYGAFQTSTTIWSYPYFGSTTNSLIYGLGRQFTTSTPSGPKSGVIEVSLVLNFLSEYIASLNTGGATQVAYIMTKSNPVGLLVATTTNLQLSTTTYAMTSTNTIINATAHYIFGNEITTDTTVYVPSAGCLMSVKFWTSPFGTPQTFPAPSSFVGVLPSTGQASWIVVSCNVEENPTMTYTTTVESTCSTSSGSMSDDDNMNVSSKEANAILAIVVIIFFMMMVLTIAFFVFAYQVSSKKPPLASQGAAGSATMEQAKL